MLVPQESSCRGLLGPGSLLGVLLLALLRPVLAGLLLLLAPLVLFVLVAPVALALLALVLLPEQEPGDKVTSDTALPPQGPVTGTGL